MTGAGTRISNVVVIVVVLVKFFNGEFFLLGLPPSFFGVIASGEARATISRAVSVEAGPGTAA